MTDITRNTTVAFSTFGLKDRGASKNIPFSYSLTTVVPNLFHSVAPDQFISKVHEPVQCPPSSQIQLLLVISSVMLSVSIGQEHFVEIYLYVRDDFM